MSKEFAWRQLKTNLFFFGLFGELVVLVGLVVLPVLVLLVVLAASFPK